MMNITNGITSQLSAIYSMHAQDLSSVLKKIARSKTSFASFEDLASFHRALILRNDIASFEGAKAELTNAKTIGEKASSLGDEIYDNLKRMKELKILYAGGTAEEKASYNSEFKSLVSSIKDTISQNDVNGYAFFSANTIETVNISTAQTSSVLKLTFAASDVDVITGSDFSKWNLETADASNVIPSEADIAGAMSDMSSYISKSGAFTESVNRQITVADSIIESKTAAESLLTGGDTAENISMALQLEIRQNAVTAMMSQANLIQSSLSYLYRKE